MTKDHTGNFSKGSQGFGETSIDSGRGTMATISSRMSSHPKPRPFPAFPLETQITEDEESLAAARKLGSDQTEVFNMFSRKAAPTAPNPLVRHPPSPPVRLRDR